MCQHREIQITNIDRKIPGAPSTYKATMCLLNAMGEGVAPRGLESTGLLAFVFFALLIVGRAAASSVELVVDGIELIPESGALAVTASITFFSARIRVDRVDLLLKVLAFGRLCLHKASSAERNEGSDPDQVQGFHVRTPIHVWCALGASESR